MTEPKANTLTTTVWAPGDKASRDNLFSQAKVNTRDAIPVAAYDVVCEVVGTSKKSVNDTVGTAWEIQVTYTPIAGAPHEQVDLEKVIKEAQAGYGITHPGDADFLAD
jgi:hypothetical protein